MIGGGNGGSDGWRVVVEPFSDPGDEVGGIESMLVDGRRWWFGFSYSSDLVLTPLIADPAVVAAFDTIGVPGDERGGNGMAQVVAALDGTGPARSAAQLILRRYLAETLDHLPGNWPDVFAGLRP